MPIPITTVFGTVVPNTICINIHIYIYIYIYRKSEAIHETGLSGNVVASFFSSHNIYTYVYTYLHIYIIYLYI